ncbi:antibiotic biosynthesis monooxygenase [Solimonas sp. K1W22B-7]|uniref:antibiotic biosynthesis monooxygenase family protein n=1 Tax=Solimonas sp. K1W22B-7 TaxID=2303331 RepID=UPI000E330936|nr:antibiotic biosynthesis monooxygenase [Solimonas sp. K1W22B-7]AXQ31583.1 antibiotic biosynthesis monooxygenase [Solimonas sp. K1W22B-7]
MPSDARHVVIFRARARRLDAEYAQVAERLRDLALSQFGCLEFVSATEGDQEIALSYWRDEADIRRWRAQADHLLAQQLGRERWYESYTVQVATLAREYGSP